MIRLVNYERVNPAVVEDFLWEASALEDKASKNMMSLLPLLPIRFTEPKGRLYLALDEGKVIGCSGVYVSDFSPDVAILGCRSVLLPEYRSKGLIRDLFLPTQKIWALAQNCKTLSITFNDYNKNLRELFLRSVVKRNPRSLSHLFYNGLKQLDYPVMIQHVPQWVLYEEILPSSFSWESIRTV